MKLAAALLVITASSFWIFPGHTYLDQDTQIYVPILEHQWNGALAHDLLTEHPHVRFTLYDELSNGLRRLTGAPLQSVLETEQWLFRALGFLGVFLIAQALGASARAAVGVTAIASLGASIIGPAVLAVELEPTPRAFAVPLTILAFGLLLRRKDWIAGIVAGCALLLHAPSMWPFPASALALAFVRVRAIYSLLPIAASAAVLLAIAAMQPVSDPQPLFATIPPDIEQLQRMRAPYNWISTWKPEWIVGSILLGIAALVGLRRLRAHREALALLGALVIAGLASIPVSFLLLEHFKWSLFPQIQPARACLFVTEVAIVVAAVAAVRAWNNKNQAEACGWLALALFASLYDAHTGQPFDPPEIARVSAWAATHTAASAVFAFPDSGHDHDPGRFRGRALRAVYVDWKGGGQVNYLFAFAREWRDRWDAVMRHPLPLTGYRALGIDFVVLRKSLPAPATPVFTADRHFVYYTGSE